MRNLNLSRRPLASSITLRALTALVIVLAPVVVYAAKGPCNTTFATVFNNTISCANGVCIGSVHIVPEQSDCANADENDCSASGVLLAVDYAPKSVNRTAVEIASHAGTGLACASCVLGILGLLTWATGGTATPAANVIVTAACGAACAAATLSMNKCWFVRCEQDLNAKNDTPGGKSCR